MLNKLVLRIHSFIAWCIEEYLLLGRSFARLDLSASQYESIVAWNANQFTGGNFLWPWWRWNEDHAYFGKFVRIYDSGDRPVRRLIKPPRLKVGDVVVLNPNTKLLERASYPSPLRIHDVGIIERVAFSRESVGGWDSFYVRFFSVPDVAITLWEVELSKVSDKPTEH